MSYSPSSTIISPTSEVINLREEGINVPPTLRIVASAQSVSGAATDVNVTLVWYEDV